MGIQKLLNIQRDLKAPKSQYNEFGKYNYRNCEDILEAVKPLCAREKACLTLSDEPVLIGERYYIQATATLYDTEDGNLITAVTASARETEDKKGMDASQITGSASSYARKYALNGLFDIDDTRDADGDRPPQKGDPAPKKSGEDGKAAAKKRALEEAKNTMITIAGKEYRLGDVGVNWIQRHVDQATDGTLKKAMQLILQEQWEKEAREDKGELPFKE